MKLHCPIQHTFLWDGNVCYVNQLFGENKNALFYGANGHSGLDLETVGNWKYVRYNQKFEDGKWSGYWKRVPRELVERSGHIPTVATHDGLLETNFLTQDRVNGYYVTVTADPENEDGKTVQYRTMHFHIETPWSSLQTWFERAKTTFFSRRVKAGEIIAICNNTGRYTTGAHLHFELKRREKKTDGSWSAWVAVDPMPYFFQGDDSLIFHRWFGGANHAYYKDGEFLSNEKAREFINSLPQIYVE